MFIKRKLLGYDYETFWWKTVDLCRMSDIKMAYITLLSTLNSEISRKQKSSQVLLIFFHEIVWTLGGGACSTRDSQCTWNRYFCLIRENKFSQKTIFEGFTKINVHKSVGALLRLQCQNSKVAFKFSFSRAAIYL